MKINIFQMFKRKQPIEKPTPKVCVLSDTLEEYINTRLQYRIECKENFWLILDKLRVIRCDSASYALYGSPVYYDDVKCRPVRNSNITKVINQMYNSQEEARQKREERSLLNKIKKDIGCVCG